MIWGRWPVNIPFTQQDFDSDRWSLLQEGQVEIEDEETVGDDGRVTKHVQVELLCNVEW